MINLLEKLPPSLELLPAKEMIYKPKNPLKVKVIKNMRLTPEDYEEDIRHIILDLSNTDYTYSEGQSVGVLPPGVDENGKPHKLRLYSIASPSEGDQEYPKSVSLCVKRVIYKDQEGNIQKGVGSNYLCDLKEGEEVLITGPAGKHFSLPADSNTDMLFFATGTGIAPFRSFLLKIFQKQHTHHGEIVLFFGTRYRKDHLYANEINDDLLQIKAANFRLYSALSRENPQKKVYVHHLLEEKKEEIYTILNRDNYAIYMCGLKGMEEPISLFLKKFYEEKFSLSLTNEEWKEIQRELEKRNRFIVETY